MRYERQKPYRLKRYFVGIFALFDEKGNSYWYNYDLKRWEYDTEAQWEKYSYSNLFGPCKTVRAFKRHLRKHPYMRGKLRLHNRYFGFDVYG